MTEVIEVKAALIQYARLHAALTALGRRERRVLEMRYALEGQPTRTLADVGRVFDVTKERVRQIENGALAKLAHHVDADDRRYTPGSL